MDTIDFYSGYEEWAALTFAFTDASGYQKIMVVWEGYIFQIGREVSTYCEKHGLGWHLTIIDYVLDNNINHFYLVSKEEIKKLIWYLQVFFSIEIYENPLYDETAVVTNTLLSLLVEYQESDNQVQIKYEP